MAARKARSWTRGSLFKACKHCGGDLALEVDEREPEREPTDEVYVWLQCGRRFVSVTQEAQPEKAGTLHKTA